MQPSADPNIKCGVCGATRQLNRCSGCHRAQYCSSICQKKHWPSHKAHCRFIAPAATEHDSLATLIQANHSSRGHLSSANPTSLNGELLVSLGDLSKTHYFFVGEIGLPVSHKRFLATIHVLSCISVFAWFKDNKNSIFALGAHIPIGAVLYGCKKGGAALSELIDTLRSIFKGCPLADVTVYVVGGHQATDNDMALKNYFPKDPRKWLFSWHVLEALRSVGLPNIDTTLLNVFPGASLQELGEGAEVRLCAANMRFSIAALDLWTGKLLTHTNHSYLFSGDSPVPELILAAERAQYAIFNPMGSRLQISPDR